MKSSFEAEDIDDADVDAAQTVLAAGPVDGLVEQVVDALRQRHRDHGEVDAAGADRQHADQRRHQQTAEHAERDRHVPGQREMHDRDAAEIGAGAEQRGVAERQQAEIAEHQIEAERVQTVDQDVHRQRRERHDQRKHQHDQAGDAGAVPRRELKPAHRRSLRLRTDGHLFMPGFTLSSSIRRGRRSPAAG